MMFSLHERDAELTPLLFSSRVGKVSVRIVRGQQADAHVMRHTFASLHTAAGISISKIGRLNGKVAK